MYVCGVRFVAWEDVGLGCLGAVMRVSFCKLQVSGKRDGYLWFLIVEDERVDR